MDILGALIEPVAGLIGKFIPDKDKANALAHDIATLAEKQHQALMLQQIEVNKIEAQSGRWFQANWRPAVGWVCVIGMLNNFVLLPYMMVFSDKIIPMDWAAMSPILMGLLGLGGLRSMEKLKGKA
jgi:hypothetical protein